MNGPLWYSGPGIMSVPFGVIISSGFASGSMSAGAVLRISFGRPGAAARRHPLPRIRHGVEPRLAGARRRRVRATSRAAGTSIRDDRPDRRRRSAPARRARRSRRAHASAAATTPAWASRRPSTTRSSPRGTRRSWAARARTMSPGPTPSAAKASAVSVASCSSSARVTRAVLVGDRGPVGVGGREVGEPAGVRDQRHERSISARSEAGRTDRPRHRSPRRLRRHVTRKHIGDRHRRRVGHGRGHRPAPRGRGRAGRGRRPRRRRRARRSRPTSAACSARPTSPTRRPMRAAVAAAVELAPLRTCIHCAGVGWAERTINRNGDPHDLDRFRKIIEINLIGTFNVLRLAAVGHGGQRARRRRRAGRDRQHRVGRRVRRPDRPGRVLGVEGRRRLAHAHRGPRPLGGRYPRVHDRARASSTRRCSAPFPTMPASRSPSRCCSRSASAPPTTSRRSRSSWSATTT